MTNAHSNGAKVLSERSVEVDTVAADAVGTRQMAAANNMTRDTHRSMHGALMQ